MTNYKKLNFLLSGKQKSQLVVLIVLMLLGVLFEMAGLGIILPALSLMLKADVVQSYPVLKPALNYLGNPTQSQLVIYVMSVIVLVYLIKTIFLIFLGWRQSKFTTELAANLSDKLFLGFLRQPYTFHLQRNSAELLYKIQGEVSQFSAVWQAFVILASEFSVIAGIFLLLVITEPVGAISVTIFFIVTGFTFYRITRNKLLVWGQNRQYHSAQNNQHLLQGLGGIKDIKLLGREDQFVSEFSFHNHKFANIMTKISTLSLIPRLYFELLSVIGMAVLIIIMALQNKPFDLVLPTLGIFLVAAFRLIPSLNRIMSSVQTVRFMQSTIDILYSEFLNIRQIELVQSIEKNEKAIFNSELVASNLSFSYPNTSSKVIKNISINIKKGQSVGFIGSSGSGKSTLVDILLGLLSQDEGTIMIDGVSIEDCKRDWQNSIGYVSQTIYLIDDSLRKNIAFGIPDALIDNASVLRAMKAAQLDEFVENLPDGLESFVGERGIRLSGGQRQRIGIARALYHDPDVLVLDEATSSLDTKTEKGVMDAVSKLKGIKTLIIIAHRLSTVENCTHLYRLEKGNIVEDGTPEQILKTSHGNVKK
jgi:ABC-type multidrug transport system fused ATPase/permease subunit